MMLNQIHNKAIAQNLVPNPSFENYSSCPSNFDEILKATGWGSFGYSPDYFNVCATNPDVAVPSNQFGFQYPPDSSCNAYCGLYTWGGGNYREYIGGALASTMVIGQKYYISFKVCLAENLTCGTNNIGLLFSKIPYSASSPPSLNNFSHIYSPAVITDTMNWTTLTGIFTSDSAYQYIIAGNFFDDSNTILNGSGCVGYYYIDDICVSTDSITCSTYSCLSAIDERQEEEIKIYPIPTNDFLQIDLLDNVFSANAYLYDYMGREIIACKINDTSKLDVRKLTSGIYFLEIKIKDKTYFKKVIKNKIITEDQNH